MSQSETPLETVANNQSQPNSSADATQQPKETEKPLSLAEIFKEPEDTETETVEGETTVESIDALAKRLKLTPEQVYSIKVPMRDNAEPLTIGALKDRVSELVDLDRRELAFDQRRVKQEGELLRSQNEMRELLAMIPKEQLKPDLVEKLRKQRSVMIENEHAALMEHVPEWREESKRTADIKGMMDHLTQYGFPEAFLSTVTDHRALKYIRDNYLRDKRIKEALARVKTPESTTNRRPSGKPARSAIKPNQQQSQMNRRSGSPDNRARIMDYLNASEK